MPKKRMQIYYVRKSKCQLQGQGVLLVIWIILLQGEQNLIQETKAREW